MKKRFMGRILITFGVAMTCSSLYSAVWTGVTAPDVTDENIVIQSDVTLQDGPTVVEAINQDIVITLDNDIQIKENELGLSRLYLIPHAGRTITFKVNKKLEFLGKVANDRDPLIIVQGGEGKVVWEIAGGNHLAFKSPVDGSGTEYYLFVQDGSDAPEAYFVRDPQESANDKTQQVYVEVGERSLMNVISTLQVGDDSVGGSFIFDPSNTDKGLMQLEVANQGGVIVSPRKTTAVDVTGVTSNQIKKDLLAGGIAQVKVINGKNSSAHASLFIANNNKKMPEFLFDPFLNLEVRADQTNYNGSFIGDQYGFIVGSHGNLAIDDNANINYVGLDVNRKSDLAEVPGYAGIDVEKLLKFRNPSALFFDQSHHPLALNPRMTFGQSAALYLRSGVGKTGVVRSIDESHPYTVEEDEQNDKIPYFVMDVEGAVDIEGVIDSLGESSKIEVLSLETDVTGGAVFVGGLETNFPVRNFEARPTGELYRYNKAAIFVNGYCKLKNMSLSHTDRNAKVTVKDDIFSEPVYIGGETYKLLKLDGAVETEINARPKIAFESSRFLLHSSAAVTGVDLLVPNQVEIDGNAVPNLTRFVWGYNGYKVDSGTGRVLILGTSVGSESYDGISVISKEAHLDIIQNTDCFDVINVEPEKGDHRLSFEVMANDKTIVQEIEDDIIEGGTLSQHVVYLGHNSNISVGTNADETGFTADTHPWLRINSNYFAFETSGGPLSDPRSGGRTGFGAIFIDLNGKFSVGGLYNAFIGSMVVKSRNAILELPVENVEFGKQVGITNWGLAFDSTRVKTAHGWSRLLDEYAPVSIPSDPVLIQPSEVISDFSVDWLNIQKDPLFVPYPINNVHLGKTKRLGKDLSNELPAVTEANMLSIPVISGKVQQLQISGSRLGDPAHICIDGGSVDELVFVDTTPDPDAGQAPVAVIFLNNGARIGLGSADRNSDSADAAVQLGRNGIIIVSNKGSNEVILNNSVIIDGNAPFLFGPDAQAGDILRISSEVDDELVVRQNGVLDCRSINNGKILEFSGQMSVVLEPNTKLVFQDGDTDAAKGIVRFSENAQLNVSEYELFDEVFNVLPLGEINNEADPLAIVDAEDTERNEFSPVINYGQGLANTDDFRVRIIGSGIIEFKDKSSAFVPYGAVVGVESLYQVIDEEVDLIAEYNTTDIQIKLQDAAKFYLGNQNYAEGGVLQIGNTVNLGPDHSVSFDLTLEGQGAGFVTGAKSVLGLNVGVAKANGDKAADYLIDTLYNVEAISVHVNDGALDLSRIYDTDDKHANIVAIGDNGDGSPLYTFAYAEVGTAVDTIAELRAQNATVLGGSPIVYLTRGSGAVAPIVREDDGQVVVAVDGDGNDVVSERIQVGMIASTLLQDVSENDEAVSADVLFDQLKTLDAFEGATPAQDKANAASEDEDFMATLKTIRLGTVAAGKLIRQSISDVFSGIDGAAEEARKQATEIGAVFADISGTLGQILSAAQIPL